MEQKLPNHVAIIMDGNGRWSKLRNVDLIQGHYKGAEVAKKVILQALESGVKSLTLYAFSMENWKRPPVWIEQMMGLLRYFLKNEVREFLAKPITLRIIGDRTRLPEDIVKIIEDIERQTQGKAAQGGLLVQVALSYSGRDEIVRVTQRLAKAAREGVVDPDTVTEQSLVAYLDTPETADIDLLIRTGGDHRISNFLLWQLAYAELYFDNDLWPDYSIDNFKAALVDFSSRARRFGEWS